MKKLIALAMLAASVALAGCARVETGEIGLRIGFDKQVSKGELMPGSFNQVLVGDVITFPVREIKVQIDKRKPMTADNSTMADFDFVVIYSINPASVADLYTTKSKGFHVHDDKHSDWVLMYNYIETIANSAAFKAVRKYEALKINDNRNNLEQEIKAEMVKALTEEKLNVALTVNQVQIKTAEIDPTIVKSANAVISAQNELKAKVVEVQTAEQEAKRIAMLNANPKAIEYMNAQANMNISLAVREGKVHSIVVPYDFKGIINAGAPK